jgi:hypothetical protein
MRVISTLPTLLLLTMSCSGGGTSAAADAAPSPICLEANSHSDLAWIQEKIFTPSCASFSACHKGTARDAGDLNLEIGMARNSMLNKPSKLFPQFSMVKPSDAANSYLMMIMGHVTGPIDTKAGTMPYNSSLLCVEKRRAVERWIMAGAADN